MKSHQDLQQTIEGDSQLAGRVIYLEGRTDPDIFFALLGVARPADGVHRGVLVKGLTDAGPGAGNSAVRQLVEYAGTHGLRGVYGVVDGDGTSHTALRKQFDPPYAGPLFAWPAYSIENLLVKAGWPADLGAPPDWQQVLTDLGPYVALNTLQRQIERDLDTLGLRRYTRPRLHEPRKSAVEVVAALARDKHRIADLDVAARFTAALTDFEATVRASTDDGHALVNGKWLVDVIAAERAGCTPAQCRESYLRHVTAAGGFPAVRELWHRIAHAPP